MKMYVATEEECIHTTPDLEPSPEDHNFDKYKLPKQPEGSMPSGQLDLMCDGYNMGWFSMAGSRLKLGGVDTGLFAVAGAFVLGIFVVGLKEGSNAIPWLNNEYGGGMWFFWVTTLVCFILALWARQQAKKDGFSYIVFSREYGTVTFPKVQNHQSLTIPFKDVELAAVNIVNNPGTQHWHIIIRSSVKRKGQKPRKEDIDMNGIMREDFQRQWNMICRFMDKDLPLPECMYSAINIYHRDKFDVWDKPLAKDKIFNPLLTENTPTFKWDEG
ncbi:hypothetical protein [Gynuella sunshinyii]|uniref:Uncharacterized protein n=1 Tax=Gynuella sunshinyii YC6258 TaxID=1445510 RepID=A0A0C5UXN1_9GAMM|nr:hypothetical protein [Gynuella sunshinyii]AJQ92065.1 hypothetical Protein YC6258_00009 [Gynuella sunshinyii YC6258]